MAIQKYVSIPQTLTVHVDNWKQAVEDYIPKHGVRFVVQAVRKGEEMEEQQAQRLNETSSTVKRRKRFIDYVFKVYHTCHRSGEKETKENRVKGGVSGSTRDLQEYPRSIL